MNNFILLLCVILLFLAACQVENTSLPIEEPPEWSREAIWYQIFVERFRNGDPDNDPSYKTTEGYLNDRVPKDWQITDWSHNWYDQEPWAAQTGQNFYQTIYMRRYGGDLQGVMDKIEYLKDLGITAVYFNPINDAPSLHKFDARNYHHVDVNFGPDPEGDMALIASEDPNDPDTWVMTAADRLFFQLVDSLHEADIKVIVDFSWNHTGRSFWAFKDILENGEQSPFLDWYDGRIVKDEETGESYFDYNGWLNIKDLPEWKKVNSDGKKHGQPYEGDLHPHVKAHIFDVCRRWMDPHGNGDVSRGLDGMRLDVAEHVPMGFWRDFRQFVRTINPEFYLVGENWWTEWPDVLMDAKPWVEGDVFDAVMHYQWYKVARGFFADPIDHVSSAHFSFAMDSVFNKFPFYTQQAMMNMAASHDSPRLLTSFYNKEKYKHNCKPTENPNYLTGQPDEQTYDRVKLFLLHQFTFIGAPQIWNGDELGMWGSDDPDNRKPLWWQDISFDNETASTYSNYTYEEEVGFDQKTFDYYKALIKLRKEHPSLVRGDLQWLSELPEHMVGYTRAYNEESIVIILNTEQRNTLSIPVDFINGQWLFQLNDVKRGSEGELIFEPFSALVISSNK